MAEQIRLVYIDEDEAWQSIANRLLRNDFELTIPQYLPKAISELWSMVKESAPQAILIDYRLNESGKVPYTGDDVIREFCKHNKHLPMFIITSFEDSALIECKVAKIIRGKEIMTNSDLFVKLKNIVTANVNNYNRHKFSAENLIKRLQDKVASGEKLSSDEEASKFDAELYLSELDLDNSVRTDLITDKSNQTLDELLRTARDIIELHKK